MQPPRRALSNSDTRTNHRNETQAPAPRGPKGLPALASVPMWAVGVLVTAALLFALGYWTYSAVERSLHEIRAQTMRTLLDTHVVALRATIEDRLEGVSGVARSARVRETASRYAETASHWGETGAVHVFEERRREHAASEAGVMMDPYPGRGGVEVIGAWRWLPDFGIGVTIEIDAEEAYVPLRYLNIAFGVVFGALVIAVAAALGSALSVLRLRKQMGEARKLGAYVLGERIGEGGMAVVYKAHHDLLERPCAVKLLKPARATDEMIARFEREVQLASQLSHPNTVEIFDYGRTADGLFYYAMEFLDGITTAELVAREGAVPVARALHILRQVCAGLAAAHAKGLVHRDIKPENVMVCRRGGEYDVAKILDFGLVKSIAEPHSRDLTRTLRILGTPLYMAPERLRNPADVDARADIYAVGALAFFLLAGKKMFDAPDDLALTSKVLNEEPPRVSAAASQEIPVELDLLVQACLEKRRDDRPQRATDLVEALDALAQDQRWTQVEAQAWWERSKRGAAAA